MSKFLNGNRKPSKRTPEDFPLSASALRILIPGNFYLLPLPTQTVYIPGLSSCMLMLHEKGIFVFLQQVRFGLIYGNFQEKYWHSLGLMGEDTPFASPYLTNQENIRLLALTLRLPESQFHSVIVFGSECDLRKASKKTNLTLMHAEEIEEHFERTLPALPPLYSDSQLVALRDIFLLHAAENE